MFFGMFFLRTNKVHKFNRIAHEKDGRILIDDSYNASPVAVEGALRLLMDLAEPGQKVVAVLGEMLELGERSDELHGGVGAFAKAQGLSDLIYLGDSASVVLGAFAGGCEVANPKEAAERVLELQPDLVLVKGSRGVGLDACVSEILKRW